MTWLALLWKAWGWIVEFVKAVPWQVWLVLGLILGVYLYGESRYAAGVTAERQVWVEWKAKQEETDRDLVAAQKMASAQITLDTQAKGQQASTDTRTETAAAVDRIKVITRAIEVPVGCPTTLPPEVNEELHRAVELVRSANDGIR